MPSGHRFPILLFPLLSIPVTALSTLYKSAEHEHPNNISKLFGQRTHLLNSKHAAGPNADCGHLHQK